MTVPTGIGGEGVRRLFGGLSMGARGILGGIISCNIFVFKEGGEIFVRRSLGVLAGQ